VDTHAAAQQSGIARLQNRIDRVLDDHRIGSCRLRCVEGVHLLVDGRNGLVLIDELLNLGVAGPGCK
jgi:hypothetical protein